MVPHEIVGPSWYVQRDWRVGYRLSDHNSGGYRKKRHIVLMYWTVFHDFSYYACFVFRVFVLNHHFDV